MNLIKITPKTTATFDIDLNAVRYTFVFVYNPKVGIWKINLLQAGVSLVTGQAAVMGVELFQGHANPLIPRNLYLAPVDRSLEDAKYAELGDRVVLVEILPEDGINV